MHRIRKNRNRSIRGKKKKNGFLRLETLLIEIRYIPLPPFFDFSREIEDFEFSKAILWIFYGRIYLSNGDRNLIRADTLNFSNF